MGTFQELICSKSTISNGTICDHMNNLISGGGGGANIYIPVEEGIGVMEVVEETVGFVESDELVGALDVQVEIFGKLDEQEALALLESNNEIKGDKSC